MSILHLISPPQGKTSTKQLVHQTIATLMLLKIVMFMILMNIY